MSQAYFITGTDTGVGKTLIAAALMHRFAQKNLRVVGMKPVAAGAEPDGQAGLLNDDVRQLQAAANTVAPPEVVNPYVFAPAIAPHLAARLEGIAISTEKIMQAFRTLTALADIVIVEGAGGFYVPLNQHEDMADLALMMNLPLILVVGMRLGCLNHALLTATAIRAQGLTLSGWVANCVDPAMPRLDENVASLRDRLKAPCLGVVPFDITADSQKAAEYLKLPD